MRFIHIADVHIGAHPSAGKAYSGNREREIFDTFKKVLERCESEKIELLLISGGLFHRQPLLRELKEVDYLFSKLSVTKVVFVVGNTDYLKENTYYHSFQWSKNVYPILSSEMSCIQINSLNVAVYGCSYHQREVKEKKLLETIKLAKQNYHILLGYGGSENHMPFTVQELELLPYNYIALGYQHKPEILVDNRIVYAGSLEPIRVEDLGSHGYIKGEMDIREVDSLIGEEAVFVRTQFVDFASREYKKIRVDIADITTNDELKEKLLEIRRKTGMQHIYLFELQGKRNPEVEFALDEVDEFGNIIDVLDRTYPGYDLYALEEKNKDNLLGAYIKSFGVVEEGSVEHMALYEGVKAIEETKRC